MNEEWVELTNPVLHEILQRAYCLQVAISQATQNCCYRELYCLYQRTNTTGRGASKLALELRLLLSVWGQHLAPFKEDDNCATVTREPRIGQLEGTIAALAFMPTVTNAV